MTMAHGGQHRSGRLGVGLVGSGFIANFHVRAWEAVRDADIVAVADPNRHGADQLAETCTEPGSEDGSEVAEPGSAG